MPGKILVIDDEEGLRKLMARVIGLEGFDIDEAGTLRTATDLLKKKPIDIILCDVKLPDGNGVDFVSRARAAYPLTEIIVLTAFGNIADGVQAMKNGAFDYLIKGNDNDKIIPLVHQAFEKVTKQRSAAVKIKDRGSYDFTAIIGESAAIREAVSLAKKIAGSDTTVLLLGETGTGKEIFANAIHTGSRRAAKPFIAINCSAFSKELLEGELFGHKAGAFTDATKDKKGLIELADEGTLFLDEIGEMSTGVQAKLLRVLETGEFIKLGDEKTTRVNVRIIAATNRDLKAAIGRGEFRQDLFYRLDVFSISLPSLAERKEDIPMLAGYFLERFGSRESKPGLALSPEAAALLKQHPWKGNIRELRNVIERAVILTDGKLILPSHLPYDIQKPDTGSPGLTLASIEKNHIEKILRYTGGNKTKAAETLGIGVSTLYRKMEEYGIQK